MTMQLPETKQSRQSAEVTPAHARVMCAGMPKSGKTTLLAGWNPDRTLIIDTHKGTTLLDGEHFVIHVSSWAEFEEAVALIVTGTHKFETIGLDLVDDLWKFADQAVAAKKNMVAAGLIEYGKGTAEAEGLFRREVGKLLASPYGVWFLSHTDTVQDEQITRYVPKLDKRVSTFVQGAVQFVFLAETLGKQRVLHTAPSAKFEAGTRVPMPEPLPLDARVVWEQMDRGLNPEIWAKLDAEAAKGNAKKVADAESPQATQKEAVPA